MISTINAAPVQPTESKNGTVLPFQPSSSAVEEKAPHTLKKTQAVIEEQARDQQARKAREQTPLEERKEKEEKEVTQDMLDELSMDLEALHSVGLSFAKHEETGRTFIKVLNKDTDELIREIPAEDVLDMAAKLDEMIGILFDAKV